ncbi:MAG: HAMP domain-containing protein [Elusimicrobia bacterium]|nr:HAMP domain-containing protein [Elusimicrobiota bacterium]
MSIRRYVVLVLLGLIGWQTLLFTGTFYYAEYNAAVREAKTRQMETLDKLRAVCQESAMRTSPFAAISYVSLLAKEPTVAHAVCADFNGRILAHTDPDRIGNYVPRDAPMLSAHKADIRLERGQRVVLEAFGPVMVQGRRAGMASVGFDAQALESGISAALWDMMLRLLLVSALALAVVVLTAVAVANRLTEPIAELARGAREIAAGNLQYSVPVSESRSDELGFLAREFNRMARRLRELDQLKERFLASVTHDLRAPLVGIQGHTELLMNEPLTEEQSQHLETIYYGAQSLSRFINDILDLSRLEAGAMELSRVRLEIRDVVASVVELMQVKADEFKIRLESRVTPELPAAHADARLVPRVLMNLVSNALKFTPEGGTVTVLASLDRTGLRPAILIEVRDTGSGIPKEKLDFVFEKFSQVDETRAAARSEGTGLGLAIAKEAILAHGGKIWAESEPGRGSRFFFSLPAVAP